MSEAPLAPEPAPVFAEESAGAIYRFSRRLRAHLPFTDLNTVWRQIDADCGALLDVGCGTGEPMAFIRGRRRAFSVGIDTFLPYLRRAKARATHDDYVRCDVRYLPFRPKSFDAVLCMEVLEHLDEPDGLAMLTALEGIARRQVILTTPVGKHEQHAFDDNPHQEHRAIWGPREMRRLGYRVIGHGVRNMGGLAGIQSPLPRPVRPLFDVIWVMAGPIARLFPELSGSMVCTKRLPPTEGR